MSAGTCYKDETTCAASCQVTPPTMAEMIQASLYMGVSATDGNSRCKNGAERFCVGGFEMCGSTNPVICKAAYPDQANPMAHGFCAGLAASRDGHTRDGWCNINIPDSMKPPMGQHGQPGLSNDVEGKKVLQEMTSACTNDNYVFRTMPTKYQGGNYLQGVDGVKPGACSN